MKAGKAIAASKITECANSVSSVRCFGANGLRGYVPRSNQSGNAVLIGRQGALCGNVYFVDGDYYATEHAVVAAPREGVDCCYLFYALAAANLNQFKTAGAQPGLSVERLKKVKVALPDVETQRRIAKTLEQFDVLINDISQGLPAEIEARRKQYAYYRDKLLSFKEKVA
ncbi:restriction endonuclease subunit S [Gordonibacter pamelaeae]|nr:restriction endonuclease subunit S [Gordonibacter pamelaeae]